MAKPAWFDMKITLGNVITIVTVALGAIWWSSKLEARVDKFADIVIELKANDTKFATDLRTAETKFAAQLDAAKDLAVSRQEAVINRLSVIDARNARIEAILERIERRP
jgi:cell division septation protein DedD